MSLSADALAGEALDVLSRFRVEFYECLYARQDALFELTDAVLCADGPVKTLVELSLAVEHRRGHGALYAALDRGWLEPTRLRHTLAGLPLPKTATGGSPTCAVSTNSPARPAALLGNRPMGGGGHFWSAFAACSAARVRRTPSSLGMTARAGSGRYAVGVGVSSAARTAVAVAGSGSSSSR